MTRSTSALSFVALCLAAVSNLLSQGRLVAAEPALGMRPNIILVMTDDQGFGELSIHGNPILKTRHLDAFAKQSLRFVDFQVSPTCAPTRCALMTGRHEFRSGVTHTIAERERMSPKAFTLAQLLKSTGYATGIFGKWHLGDEEAYLPSARGFDEVFIHGAGGIGQTYPGSCGDAPGNTYFDPAIWHNDRFERTKGFCTDVFFEQALQWIDAKRSDKEPFFCYLTPNAPHSPYDAPAQDAQPLLDQGLSKEVAGYYGMIQNIDDNFGRLIAKLKEWELDEKTLVIFMTDNGHPIHTLYNAGMRGAKVTPYLGGTRVPAFWRWTRKIKPGEAAQLAAHLDVFPTFAELTGAQMPAIPLDGRSLLPILKNARAEWPDRTLFTHVGRWPKGKAGEAKFDKCAVRTARFHLVNNQELFDLASDPGEQRNVIDHHPGQVAAMREAYDRWWSEILPALENEEVVGPPVNPFKARYWQQFGGGPK